MVLVSKNTCGDIFLEIYTKTPGTCALQIYNYYKIVELNINHHKIMEANIYYVYIWLPFGAERIFFLQVMPHELTRTVLWTWKVLHMWIQIMNLNWNKRLDMVLFWLIVQVFTGLKHFSWVEKQLSNRWEASSNNKESSFT